MAYLNPFLRLVCNGTIYADEQFSFSVNFVGGNEVDRPLEVPAEVITEVSRYFGNSSAPLSLQAALTQIKLNVIGVDGKYLYDDTIVHDFPTPVPGGGSANIAPQLSLVVGTTTSAARGRAHAGRYYLPLPAGAPEAPSGVLSTTYQNAAANQAKLFLDTLNDALFPWHAGVVSNLGTGTQRNITGIRVGRVIDTMRSRREKIPESYQSIALLPIGP